MPAGVALMSAATNKIIAMTADRTDAMIAGVLLLNELDGIAEDMYVSVAAYNTPPMLFFSSLAFDRGESAESDVVWVGGCGVRAQIIRPDGCGRLCTPH